jgi:hypothetical protein
VIQYERTRYPKKASDECITVFGIFGYWNTEILSSFFGSSTTVLIGPGRDELDASGRGKPVQPPINADERG